jgi:3-oxoacyl-[acyl-carrier-protein] synthase II
MQTGAIGVASTVTAGHAAGASAMTYAFDLAASGKADAVLCIAADTLTDSVLDGYRDLGLLTKSAPGSEGTDGFALAEGCVALLLERASHAEARGARSYGELRGYAITSDAQGLGRIDESGAGIEQAMRLALERAGLEPGEITAVWAASCGLPSADEAERLAIERVFGADVEVAAPKRILGEPMGVGGSLMAALALKSWEHGAPAGPVLVNSLSLGGTNFSVVLAPPA